MGVEEVQQQFAVNNNVILLKYAANKCYICRINHFNMAKYIYEYVNWPHFIWNENEILPLLSKVRLLQGKIIGQMSTLGFKFKSESILSTLTLDVLKSSEIEGETLNYDQVRSSIARRLGLEIAGMTHAAREVEGVVEMMLDATQNYGESLSEERLFGWHAALFPTGWSGMHKIDTGCYRKGDMQIISGAMGKEKIHFQAPSHERMKNEMDILINWINDDSKIDFVLKAAITHFWFIIIHPFDDGNGRIARALSDLFLARSENSSQRFYSLSNQILIDKKSYYDILKKVQHSAGDISEWIEWFLNCLYRALIFTEEKTNSIICKAEFWDKHEGTILNSRQRLMLNKILDEFTGKLTTSKWAKISKCSSDTALRDIKDLIEKEILMQEESGGRSVSYTMK